MTARLHADQRVRAFDAEGEHGLRARGASAAASASSRLTTAISARCQEVAEQSAQFLHALVVEADIAEHRHAGAGRARSSRRFHRLRKRIGRRLPTRALAKGVSGATKFFITAPFMIVGSRPASGQYPAGHAGDGRFAAGAADRDAGCALVEQAGQQFRPAHPRAAQFRARDDFGDSVLDRRRGDQNLAGRRIMPLPSCGKQREALRIPARRIFPACGPGRGCGPNRRPAAPCPFRISASGNMPDPPMPQKNQGCAVRAGQGRAHHAVSVCRPCACQHDRR